jgi:anti-sigma B factor antagonist
MKERFFSLSVREKGKGAVIFEPSGDIDVNSISQLKERLEIELQKNKLQFVFNMKDVNYLDSSGIGVFISLKKRLDVSGDVVLFNLQGTSKNIFELSRLVGFFKVYSSEEEALSHFCC